MSAVTGPPGGGADAIGDALAVANRFDSELTQIVEVAVAARADHAGAAMLGQLGLDASDPAGGCRDHDRVIRADLELIQGVQRRGTGEEQPSRRLPRHLFGLDDEGRGRNGHMRRLRPGTHVTDHLGPRLERAVAGDDDAREVAARPPRPRIGIPLDLATRSDEAVDVAEAGADHLDGHFARAGGGDLDGPELQHVGIAVAVVLHDLGGLLLACHRRRTSGSHERHVPADAASSRAHLI